MIAWYFWVAFVGGVILLLLVDLLGFNRRPHALKAREAAIASAAWIALGLTFGAVVWLALGPVAAQEYLAGYLIEKSLSVDNLFVFVIVFAYFRVPAQYQHRVLFYGVFGALVLRGIFIALGAELLDRFSWIAFLFGAFLLFTAYRLGSHGGVDVHPEQNWTLRLMRRFLPMTAGMREQQLVAREEGRWKVTPLFATLVVIESTDVLFAVDSIPAVFGVTRRPFIVFSSNAFALLGLRSLYFLLADMVRRFRYLDRGLAIILGLVGLKLIYEELVHMREQGGLTVIPDWLLIHIPAWIPLAMVAVVLTVAVLWSLRHERSESSSE